VLARLPHVAQALEKSVCTIESLACHLRPSAYACRHPWACPTGAPNIVKNVPNSKAKRSIPLFFIPVLVQFRCGSIALQNPEFRPRRYLPQGWLLRRGPISWPNGCCDGNLSQAELRHTRRRRRELFRADQRRWPASSSDCRQFTRNRRATACGRIRSDGASGLRCCFAPRTLLAVCPRPADGLLAKPATKKNFADSCEQDRLNCLIRASRLDMLHVPLYNCRASPNKVGCCKGLRPVDAETNRSMPFMDGAAPSRLVCQGRVPAAMPIVITLPPKSLFQVNRYFICIPYHLVATVANSLYVKFGRTVSGNFTLDRP